MSIWVIKIGTSLLRGDRNNSTEKIIDHFCECISKSKKSGEQVIIVTSGAVGLGCKKLGIKSRPQNILYLQASAAVGQGFLMTLYQKGMERNGFNVAQVLLTRSDFESREAYQNASKTLLQLLDWGVVPIINENDVLSADELKYGDNDTLSALVAASINADNLILLTDVDNLYSEDPKKNINAKPIKEVYNPREIKEINNESINKGHWGTGGIKTKLTAARIATESGVKVQLADGRSPNVLIKIFEGIQQGTIFHPHPEPLANKKSWLANVISPVGEIYIDQGASEAIQKKGASLLLVGINKINGEFHENQPVRILNKENNELAKGITSIGSKYINEYIQNRTKLNKSPIAVHRDALVITNNSS